MAKGDAVVAIVNQAGNSSMTVQPAAGVEYMISHVHTFGDGAVGGWANLYDGSNIAYDFLKGGVVGDGDKTSCCWRDGRVYINNTNYLFIYNQNAGAQNIAYSGAQTK